jgi:stress response protein YsnF
VVKEEIKVEKVPRVTEEVVIRTQPETEVIERDVQVRHERVEVEEEGEVDETTSAGATRSTPRSSPG